MRSLVIRGLVVATLALALAGCAQNAQTLRLDVAPAEPQASVAGGPPVALETADRRGDDSLGELENLEGPPAPLTAAQDIAYVVKLAAGETLSRAGFPPQLWSDEASPRLLIEINELRHTVSADIPRIITTRVTLTARAWRAGERFSAQASTTLTGRSMTRPGPERNARDIERAIHDVLRQLFDERLTSFLAGRG